MKFFSRSSLLISLAFTLMGLASPQNARGQFIGFTSPQTVTQTLFTAQTTPTQVLVRNLGQVVHYVTYQTTSANCTVSMAVVGSFDGINFFPISAEANMNGLLIGGANATGIIGYGYFPVIAVKLYNLAHCAGQSISASYVGTSTSIPSTFGVFQQSNGMRQAVLQDADLSGAQAVAGNIATPFNNSAGTLYVQCVTTNCGSSAAITLKTALSPPLTTTTIATITVANTQTLQSFAVPSVSSQFLTLNIASGAFSGTDVNIYYEFDNPGFGKNPNLYSHIAGTTATAVKGVGGTLHTLTVNTPAAGTISIFDLASAACTGTPSTNTVAVLTIGASTAPTTFTYDTALVNGICVKASAAMDLSASFQ